MSDYMSDYMMEICEQADYFGVESLTENQQALYDGSITEEQYERIEGYYE